MSKRHSFEELLKVELRWPRAGDKAFVIAENPGENANIADDPFKRLVFMVDGYKKAADILVERSQLDTLDRDLLVFPIIFNYRQFLELSVKYQLSVYGPMVDIEPNWASHRREELWGAFLEMLDRYGTPDPDQADPIVGEIMLEFAKIDPQSYSYRYPVDRNGKPLPVSQQDLHLPTLADVMNAVAGYFTGCDGYLSALQGAAPAGV